ncbi:carbamoyltransferase family protein [Desulfobacca acetoxidans]|uniref:Carbamoyltransferase n=1 Tax=Desulfobacca acetoxidans (strain ATCC 700848 / DSM 11109 / ASRB2) TaxID=880072 RepID=F2NJS2_DESAR|nr:carbamoyltransferase C-terminal domain-containing protein [Desulfobacca acetoxidans]AEB09727.1 Carbamoyltransferase [Desulfobacca acetoxidans DSM 11109]
MHILALHLGHDSQIALYDDFERLYIAKEERFNRIKCYNSKGELPRLSFNQLGHRFDLGKVEAVVMTRTFLPRRYYRYFPLRKRISEGLKSIIGRQRTHYDLISRMRKYQKPESELLNLPLMREEFGIPLDSRFFFSNHHYCHALPALFFKPHWDNALIYTADGGGDYDHYGLYHFYNSCWRTLFGGDAHIFDRSHSEGRHSLGQMYSIITEIAGFKRMRHEGKITGLAAYGKPTVYEALRSQYYIRPDGVVRSHFADYNSLEHFLRELSKKCPIENLAASGQRVLEDVLAESVQTSQKLHPFCNLGLSGGVFSNVRLNQVLSELPGIEDVFIVPPMTDEGLVIGAVMDVVIQEHGFDYFLNHRRELGHLYWGDEFPPEESWLDERFEVVARDEIVPAAVKLLQDEKVCALFTRGMEYGPRALGARSILISPVDRNINDTINKRLSRTEFMPFAPVVRLERAAEVFEVTGANLAAMQYMTITCRVRSEWADKIPAVIHIDGTARPQTIRREDNPLYYDILWEYEKATGLPCLVNTSFNAHEEPIIRTPQEALTALQQNRVDYVIFDRFIVGTRNQV